MLHEYKSIHRRAEQCFLTVFHHRFIRQGRIQDFGKGGGGGGGGSVL